MKKIALLFAIICAGQLYGMEPMEAEHIGDLPKELQKEIAQTVVQTAMLESKNVGEAIATIKKLSESFGIQYNKLFGNIQDFTKLVYMLLDGFEVSPYLRKGTPYLIVRDLQDAHFTLASKYLVLREQLDNSVFQGDKNIEKTKKLIEEGADVNSSTILDTTLSANLLLARPAVQTIKLLLDHGANPYAKNIQDLTPLEFANEQDGSQEIIELLQNAMEKEIRSKL